MRYCLLLTTLALLVGCEGPPTHDPQYTGSAGYYSPGYRTSGGAYEELGVSGRASFGGGSTRARARWGGGGGRGGFHGTASGSRGIIGVSGRSGAYR